MLDNGRGRLLEGERLLEIIRCVDVPAIIRNFNFCCKHFASIYHQSVYQVCTKLLDIVHVVCLNGNLLKLYPNYVHWVLYKFVCDKEPPIAIP